MFVTCRQKRTSKVVAAPLWAILNPSRTAQAANNPAGVPIVEAIKGRYDVADPFTHRRVDELR